MPKVTVALITYNRTQYLKQAIEGVLSQSYKDYELILMDNGSTHETFELIKPYLNEKVIYHRNPQNSMEYFNKAFSLSTGEYLLITHDDDIMLPAMLEQQVKILENKPKSVLVGCNVSVIDTSGTIIVKRGNNHEQNYTFNQYEYIKSFFSGGLQLFCPTILLRKSFFIENGLFYNFRVGPAADNFLWFETNLFPVELELLSESLLFHRAHKNQDSLSNQFTMELYMFKKTIEMLKQKLTLKELKELINPIIQKFAYSSAYAFKAEKISKNEFISHITYCKRILLESGKKTVANSCFLFFLQNCFSFTLLMHKVNVHFKKL